MGDIINKDEMGHSSSRYERMHEQYNNFVEEEEDWQGVRKTTRYLCLASVYMCSPVTFVVTRDRNWLAGRIAVAAPPRSLSRKRKRGRGWRKG